MKKLAAAILLLVYFTVSTGFVVSVHYCMNKLASVELGYTGESECGKCGMNIVKSDGCCKDDVNVVKLKADHQLAKLEIPDFSLAMIVSPVPGFPLLDFSARDASFFAQAHGPPLPPQDLYLLHRVFRI